MHKQYNAHNQHALMQLVFNLVGKGRSFLVITTIGNSAADFLDACMDQTQLEKEILDNVVTPISMVFSGQALWKGQSTGSSFRTLVVHQ